MSVTANVTRDTGRTSGVTHGPITRSDPIRSDPALLQLLLWSPSHHGVQKVSTREAAPVVAPSPVATPDGMMSLTAIEHLDFEPELPREHTQHPMGWHGHSGPGWALIERRCQCGYHHRIVVCHGWWERTVREWTSGQCRVCRSTVVLGVDLRIVQVLR